MPDVCARSTRFTWAIPLMVGAPVARLLGRAATAAVGSLVSDSTFPASSVKDTRTLMVRPTSLRVRVRLGPSAPSMSLPRAIHW